MALEYAIFDDDGKQFGLPARSWTSIEAANQALDYLRQRRREMEQKAVDAKAELDFTLRKEPLPVQHREALESAVAAWDREKERVYSVLKREVGQWQPA